MQIETIETLFICLGLSGEVVRTDTVVGQFHINVDMSVQFSNIY